MESNRNYYLRRALIETAAARSALTPGGAARRMQLAETFAAKAREYEGVPAG